MRKHIPWLFFLILICSGCGKFLTEAEVNATVVAKIKEVAALQRVNVTVETVVVKEYVVVTTTPGPTATVPVQYVTLTPIGFNRFSKEDVYQSLAAGGLSIRQYYYELGQEEIDGLTKQVVSATQFTVRSEVDEHIGRVYIFDKKEKMDDAFIYLTSDTYNTNGNPILRHENVLIELDSRTPAAIEEQIRTILNSMR